MKRFSLALVLVTMINAVGIRAQDGKRPFVPVTDAMLAKPEPGTG
jgi:hypothetical protein